MWLGGVLKAGCGRARLGSDAASRAVTCHARKSMSNAAWRRDSDVPFSKARATVCAGAVGWSLAQIHDGKPASIRSAHQSDTVGVASHGLRHGIEHSLL